MKVVEINNKLNDKKISDILKTDNSIAILPTDTIYGLFATVSIKNKKLLNILKGRDEDSDITVMFYSLKEAYKYIETDEETTELLETNLPGRKTFIVKLKKGMLSEFDKQGKREIGIRVIGNDKPRLKNILKLTGPLFATSCNQTGKPPLYHSKDIKEVFGNSEEIKIFAKTHQELSGRVPSKIFDISDGKQVKIIR